MATTRAVMNSPVPPDGGAEQSPRERAEGEPGQPGNPTFWPSTSSSRVDDDVDDEVDDDDDDDEDEDNDDDDDEEDDEEDEEEDHDDETDMTTNAKGVGPGASPANAKTLTVPNDSPELFEYLDRVRRCSTAALLDRCVARPG